MTPEIMKAKTLRHNLERTWRRSRTHLDCSRYKHQCHLCNRMMTKNKSKYLAEVISENSDNPRRLCKPNTFSMPEFTLVKSLSGHLSKYFVDKIENLRSKFPDEVQNIPQVQKTEIRSKPNGFEMRQKMKWKSLFWTHRQNHVIWTPSLQACWKIVLTY